MSEALQPDVGHDDESTVIDHLSDDAGRPGIDAGDRQSRPSPSPLGSSPEAHCMPTEVDR
jgi:hypothetical protein